MFCGTGSSPEHHIQTIITSKSPFLLIVVQSMKFSAKKNYSSYALEMCSHETIKTQNHLNYLWAMGCADTINCIMQLSIDSNQ